MDKRLFPVTPEFFHQTILPLIEDSYIWKGRPPKISHYHVFCAILYVLVSRRKGAVTWKPPYGRLMRYRLDSERAPKCFQTS